LTETCEDGSANFLNHISSLSAWQTHTYSEPRNQPSIDITCDRPQL